jgi:hypothetical protein
MTDEAISLHTPGQARSWKVLGFEGTEKPQWVCVKTCPWPSCTECILFTPELELGPWTPFQYS